MKILITGKGTSGSWQIRGMQLGRAIEAVIQPGFVKTPKRFDAAILVKRPTMMLLDQLKGTPIIWDVVDAWPQPAGNRWSHEESMAWMRQQVRMIRPVAFVAATRAMEADLAEFGLPTITVPHHARPNQELNPIRDTVHRVGYEGSETHLGRWKVILEAECAKRGWKFVMNPPVLADLDIVVGLRDLDGYPIRRWKSGVKLANAQGTGTPCVMSPECGYLETQSGAESWAEDERSLAHAFDALDEYHDRAVTSRILQTAAPHLADVAARYKQWLGELSLGVKRCA